MKKNLVSMFALATMLLATGCSSDEEIVGVDSSNYVDASFTVELGEGAESRALGDGTQVDELLYGIFDQNGNAVPVIAEAIDVTAEGYTPNYVGTATIANHTATVKMRLVKGQTYDFVFWAQVKGNAYYTHGNDLKQISVTYDSYANDEGRDAFFNHVDDHTVVSHFTKTVELRRPFGQLNVGTAVADYKAAEVLLGGSPVTKSELVVAKLPNTLNLLDGSIEGTSANATFQMAYLPMDAATTYETIAVDADNNGIAESYVHLSMNYLLADVKEGTNSYLYDVTLKFANQSETINEIAVPQIPVHRNYKTNIVGNILTTQGDFTVIVKPEFETPDNIIPIWDGTSVEEVTANAEGEYEIYNAAQLAWVAQQVDKADANNSEGSNFKDQTVKLMSDIDLANNMWNPIGTTGDARGFEGIFDGNGKTISNLYVDLTNVPGDQAAGLFASANAATIKNFTVKNAIVKNMTTLGTSGTAVVLGSSQYGITIENVKVENAIVESNRLAAGVVGYFKGTVSKCLVDGIKLTATPDDLDNNGIYDNGDKVGGIVANVNGNGTISENIVNNFTICAYRDMGGIVGSNYADVSKNKATNGTITVDQTVSPYEGSPKEANAGEIVGRKLGGTIDDDQNFENVEIIQDAQTIIRTQSAFQAALTNGGTIYLGKNTESRAATADYTWSSPAASFKIVGMEEGIVINMNNKANTSHGAKNIEVAFEGVTLDYNNVDYSGFQHSISETYKNCEINGVIWPYAPKVTFEGCSFNQTGDAYNIWMYGADTNEIEISDCDFASFCKSILIYAESAKKYDVVIENSTFTSEKYDSKAAVQMHTEYGVYGTLTMNNVSVAGKYLEFQKNGGLYNEINKISGAETNNFVKVINGKNTVGTAEGLRQAITAAKDGDIIYLADGTYTGLFSINKSITLKAVNDRKATINGMVFGENEKTVKLNDLVLTNETVCTIPNSNAGNRKAVVVAYQNNFEIENCTFNLTDKDKYGFYDESNDANNYNIIKKCIFNCNGNRPIMAKTNITVEGCTFYDQYRYSLQVMGQGDVNYITKVIFKDNIIVDACKTSEQSYVAGLSIGKNHPFKNVNIEIQGNTAGIKYVYDNHKNVTDYWSTVTVTGDIAKNKFEAVD